MSNLFFGLKSSFWYKMFFVFRLLRHSGNQLRIIHLTRFQPTFTLLEFLVGQQLNVGKYYLKRNNPAAAIRRFKKIKETTKVSSFLPEVSYRLIESFLLLGLSSEARSEGEYMRKKFSNSSYVNCAKNCAN